MSWNIPPDLSIDEFEREFNRKLTRFVTLCYNNLVALSPVDTGRYRNAHHISMGQPSYAMNGSIQINIPVGYYQPIYLQNNLPYCIRLENGWSKQAPTGVYQNAFNSAVASMG